MNPVLTISALIAVALLVALIAILRKATSDADLPLNADWIEELSTDRYRPMMRLLDRRDLEFLRSQTGFTPQMATRLRRERCIVFRGYVQALSADFRRVCTAVKLLMLQSRRDRPDLAAVLLKQQALFAAATLMIQVRVFCYRWDICGVDASLLLRTFDLMRQELRSLAPASVSATA